MNNMQKARAKLLLKHPFFATLVMSTPIIETRDVPTLATDMAKVYYNPDFVATLSVEQIMTGLAHEVMHIALSHGIRLHSRDPRVWNYATDYQINLTLVDSGFEPIDGWLYDLQYRGLSADQTYEKLMRQVREQRQQRQPGEQGQGQGQDQPGEQGQGQPGDGLPDNVLDGDVRPAQASSPDEEAAMRQSIRQRVAQAATAARMAGKLSGSLAGLVDEIISPAIPWEELLRFYMTRISRDNETWSRPNRRFPDVFLPSRYSVKLGDIVFIGDSSGSISLSEHRKVAGAVADVAETMRPEHIRLVWADTKVAGEQVFEPGEPITCDPRGGGGTDMRVPLEYVSQFNPDVVVLLTDGYTPWPEVEPDYPLIVVCTTNTNVPIGEVVRI